MKALAAEITRKMSKRLGWIGVTAKELTGLALSLVLVAKRLILGR